MLVILSGTLTATPALALGKSTTGINSVLLIL